MSTLLYRPDWEEARDRLTRWWHGEDLGRAMLQIATPREVVVEPIEQMPVPPGVICPNYTARDIDFRVNLARRQAADICYFGEAVPRALPGDLGPNTLALFLGCDGVEMPGTVWFRPCITDTDSFALRYDPDNFYWQVCKRLHEESLKFSSGKWLHQFPDLIEGLDTLAALRGSQQLLVDLLDRPEWVYTCLQQITQLYFRYYDVLYDLIRDEIGGSVFWCWAPGRLVKLQCDISCSISPAMFRDFMMPVLQEMTERTSYSLYHLDGPAATVHLEALLSLPRLGMVQWIPGAGVEPAWHSRYWPMYHDIIEAGKRVMIFLDDVKQLSELKREFAEKSQSFIISVYVHTPAEAQRCIKMMEL